MTRRSFEQKKKKCETGAFYVPPDSFLDGKALFPPEEEHHIRNVLRLGPGTVVEVLDGVGGNYSVELSKVIGSGLAGRVLSFSQSQPPVPRISAAVAVGRLERMRIAVEKLAELGCHRIVPLVTEHVSFAGDAAKQAAKLRRVALSSMKQSRSPFLTRVQEPARFEQFLESAEAEKLIPVFCSKKSRPDQGGKKEKALENLSRKALPAGQEYILVIGPEGGFSAREQEDIAASGYPCLHLGQADLRFETAAVSGFVLLRQILSDDFFVY